MIKKEAKFAIKFRHWLKANPVRISCTFEIKDTRGAKSLPFKDLKEVDERDKAVGVPLKHNGIKKVFWCPKSQISNIGHWKENKFIDVPDWLYDKKIDELFF